MAYIEVHFGRDRVRTCGVCDARLKLQIAKTNAALATTDGTLERLRDQIVDLRRKVGA